MAADVEEPPPAAEQDEPAPEDELRDEAKLLRDEVELVIALHAHRQHKPPLEFALLRTLTVASWWPRPS